MDVDSKAVTEGNFFRFCPHKMSYSLQSVFVAMSPWKLTPGVTEDSPGTYCYMFNLVNSSMK